MNHKILLYELLLRRSIAIKWVFRVFLTFFAEKLYFSRDFVALMLHACAKLSSGSFQG